MSDSILAAISRILAGDRDAVAWLYDTFAPRLLRRLGQRFGSIRGLDREDLLHDTFLYVLDHDGRVLERFVQRTADAEATEEALDRFLWSAACGIASNRRRSVLRHPAAPIDDQQEVASAGGGEGPAVARDVLERLGDCLFRRGERLYLYFQLRYLDGLRPAEIAQATGWSRKAAYKLKQSLDEALDRCVVKLGLAGR